MKTQLSSYLTPNVLVLISVLKKKQKLISPLQIPFKIIRNKHFFCHITFCKFSPLIWPPYRLLKWLSRKIQDISENNSFFGMCAHEKFDFSWALSYEYNGRILPQHELQDDFTTQRLDDLAIYRHDLGPHQHVVPCHVSHQRRREVPVSVKGEPSNRNCVRLICTRKKKKKSNNSFTGNIFMKIRFDKTFSPWEKQINEIMKKS